MIATLIPTLCHCTRSDIAERMISLMYVNRTSTRSLEEVRIASICDWSHGGASQCSAVNGRTSQGGSYACQPMINESAIMCSLFNLVYTMIPGPLSAQSNTNCNCLPIHQANRQRSYNSAMASATKKSNIAIGYCIFA